MNDKTAQPALGDEGSTSGSVVDLVAEKAHEAIDTMAAKVKPAVERVQSVASQTAESFQAKADALGELEDRWLDTTRGHIREQPLTAVAIGLLAGVLLSRLSK